MGVLGWHEASLASRLHEKTRKLLNQGRTKVIRRISFTIQKRQLETLLNVCGSDFYLNAKASGIFRLQQEKIAGFSMYDAPCRTHAKLQFGSQTTC